MTDQIRKGENPCAVITGAASGIGASVVGVFLERGWRVIALDKNLVGLQNLLKATAENERGKLDSYSLDVSQGAEVRRFGEYIANHDESVNALVNAAGIGLFARRLEDITDDEWNQVMGVNLTGPFLLTRTVIPYMANGGHVINFSSVHATATSFGMAAYASSKAGLIGLTRATSVDYRTRGIHANCLVIGSVDTPMSQQHREAQLRLNDSHLNLTIDPDLVASPRQIATVVHFLCSAEAEFVNGAAICVDGGLLGQL